MVPRLALPPFTPLTDQMIAPGADEAAVKLTTWPGPAAEFCGLIVTEPLCTGAGGGCDGAVGAGGGCGLGDGVAVDVGLPPPHPFNSRKAAMRQVAPARARQRRSADIPETVAVAADA